MNVYFHSAEFVQDGSRGSDAYWHKEDIVQGFCFVLGRLMMVFHYSFVMQCELNVFHYRRIV